MTPTRRELLDETVYKTVVNLPRCTVGQLATHLNMNRSSVSSSLSRLRKLGRVAYDFVPSTAVRGYREIQAFYAVGELDQPVVTDSNQELEDLRAFKEMALARYPDLAVEPKLLKARQLLARHHNNEYSVAILAGKFDEEAGIQALLEVL